MTFYKELGKKLREHHEAIDEKVEKIDKHTRYINTELDYCCLGITVDSNISIEANMVVPFNTFKNGNMEYNINDCSIKLKAGKTYEISTDYNPVQGMVTNILYDKTNANRIGTFVKISPDAENGVSPGNAVVIYTPATDCEIQVKATWLSGTPKINTNNPWGYFIVKEINRQIIIDPLEYVNTTQGIEDTPVGHIIAHMGTVAPKHYLICDGTEYNITDYPYLAQHIEDNFGSINFFGGDGETTFAVPDLRGEFLRGAGNNGAAVGVHQEGTEHPRIAYSSKYNYFQLNSGIDHEYFDGRYVDKYVMLSEGVYTNTTTKEGTKTNDVGVAYTSRPTNTSVLYCIKYEPTYFMNTYNTNYMQPSMYSEEERVVGCWIDGKPLYEKTIVSVTPNEKDAVKNIIALDESIENVISLDGYMLYTSSGHTYNIPLTVPRAVKISESYYYSSTWTNINTHTILMCVCEQYINLPVYITIQYTKVTDEENSFTNDMLKDSYVELTYSDEEISTMVSDILGGEE